VPEPKTPSVHREWPSGMLTMAAPPGRLVRDKNVDATKARAQNSQAQIPKTPARPQAERG